MLRVTSDDDDGRAREGWLTEAETRRMCLLLLTLAGDAMLGLAAAGVAADASDRSLGTSSETDASACAAEVAALRNA